MGKLRVVLIQISNKAKAQIPAGSDASAWRPRNASSMGSFCLFELYPATWEQITSYLKSRPAIYKKAVVRSIHAVQQFISNEINISRSNVARLKALPIVSPT